MGLVARGGNMRKYLVGFRVILNCDLDGKELPKFDRLSEVVVGRSKDEAVREIFLRYGANDRIVSIDKIEEEGE